MKEEAPFIMYTSSSGDDDGYYDDYIDQAIAEAEAEVAAAADAAADEPSRDCHRHATVHSKNTRFVSLLNGTILCVINCNPSPKIINAQYIESWEYLQDFPELSTIKKKERFLLLLLKRVAYLRELERDPTKLLVILSASEGLIESLPEPPTYKHQEHYCCFDGDFDNDDNNKDGSDDDYDNGSIFDDGAEFLWLCLRHKSSLHESRLYTQASPLPSITPTTTPTTAAVDLLLSLIN